MLVCLGGRFIDGEGLGLIMMLPLLPLSTCAAVQNRMDMMCMFRGVAHGRRLQGSSVGALD